MPASFFFLLTLIQTSKSFLSYLDSSNPTNITNNSYNCFDDLLSVPKILEIETNVLVLEQVELKNKIEFAQKTISIKYCQSY